MKQVINIAVVLLGMLLVMMQYRLWFDHGILHVRTLSLNVADITQKNQDEQRCNERLDLEIQALKNHEVVIEEKARYELGMIKPGETFYQFIEDQATDLHR